MKAKYIIMLIVCAVVTLSFTLASTSHAGDKTKSGETKTESNPAGGLTSEDPIK